MKFAKILIEKMLPNKFMKKLKMMMFKIYYQKRASKSKTIDFLFYKVFFYKTTK